MAKRTPYLLEETKDSMTKWFRGNKSLFPSSTCKYCGRKNLYWAGMMKKCAYCGRINK